MFLADEARDKLISMVGVTEETPFGPEVLVYKVGGKMFATLGMDNEVARMPETGQRLITMEVAESAGARGELPNKDAVATLEPNVDQLRIATAVAESAGA